MTTSRLWIPLSQTVLQKQRSSVVPVDAVAIKLMQRFLCCRLLDSLPDFVLGRLQHFVRALMLPMSEVRVAQIFCVSKLAIGERFIYEHIH